MLVKPVPDHVGCVLTIVNVDLSAVDVDSNGWPKFVVFCCVHFGHGDVVILAQSFGTFAVRRGCLRRWGHGWDGGDAGHEVWLWLWLLVVVVCHLLFLGLVVAAAAAAAAVPVVAYAAFHVQARYTFGLL